MKYLITNKVYEKPIYQYIKGKLPNRKDRKGVEVDTLVHTVYMCIYICIYIDYIIYMYICI